MRVPFPIGRSDDGHGAFDRAGPPASPTVTLDDVHEFLDLVDSGDVDAATRFVLDVRAARVPLESVVTSLLARAQELVGTRWQQNVWSEEQERACTALVEATLSALVARERAERVPNVELGEVVVCCADGDEHTLAARMLSELLRARGRRVTFLGSATPLSTVARHMEEISPVAVAVSASVPFTLPGVHRVITAAHGLGIPVVVGGRGFAGRRDRAEALGADGYSQEVGSAVALIDAWSRMMPRLARPPVAPAEALRLDADALVLARAALREIPPLPSGVAPILRDVPSVRRGTEHLLRCVSSAVLVRDDDVFLEYLDWLTEAVTARGVATEALAGLLRAAARAVAPEFVESRRLLHRGADQLSSR